MPRYEGPVDPIEWTFLENYYSGLFADFITDRIQGLVDTEPIEGKSGQIPRFPGGHCIRKSESSSAAGSAIRSDFEACRNGPSQTTATAWLRSECLRCQPHRQWWRSLPVELFVTAAQQEALSDTALLTALLDEADSLGSMSKEAAMSRLHRPVLMVSLWDNQEEGLNEWLDNGRHGILEMATATGKTVAGIAAIAECCGVLPEDPDHEPRTDDAKIMIVAHSNAILKQWGAGDTGEARAPNACWTDG